MTWLCICHRAPCDGLDCGDNPPGTYGAGVILSLMLYGAALIVALGAWLIWAVVA